MVLEAAASGMNAAFKSPFTPTPTYVAVRDKKIGKSRSYNRVTNSVSRVMKNFSASISPSFLGGPSQPRG